LDINIPKALTLQKSLIVMDPCNDANATQKRTSFSKEVPNVFQNSSLNPYSFLQPFLVPIHLPFLEYTPGHKNNISLPLLSPLPQEVVKFLLHSCNSLLRKEEDIFGY